MRDGVALNATIYLPRSQTGPAPAVFTLTPYIGQTWHDRGVYFAAHGYPFLTVDVRGRGNSEGEFRPFASEGKDGHDIVEWLARQPYCDGKVAMWGGSYAGLDQWTTAAELPPHLATIVPVASPFIGVDIPIRNNLIEPYWMQWLSLVAGRTSQDKLFYGDEPFWAAQFRQWFESGSPFREIDRFVGNPSTIFQEWIDHPCQDDYWNRCNPTAEQYARIAIPILTITGAYDSDQPGALAHYREHLKAASPEDPARHHLVIGPWDHGGTRTPQSQVYGLDLGPASFVDLPKLHRDWYAWTMRSGPQPEFLRKPVAYYVTGAEEWRYADTLEAATSRSLPLYLQSTDNPTDVFHSGTLVAEPLSESGSDHYVHDPRDTRLAALEASLDLQRLVVDQTMVHAFSGKQLVYHGAPFERDIEIIGFFRLSAWISIDQPDTDFRVSVYEVGLEGGSVLLATDSIRARYRESLRRANLVRTTEALRYDFERFTFVARVARKGHRLRLVIGPINSIYAQRNCNSGGVVAEESMRDARPVTVTLFHDAAHPSALYVPLGPGGKD
jgi:uncharacterized protein